MKNNLIFIPQVNHGIGHITRCLTLAESFRDWNIIFLVKNGYGINLINYPKKIIKTDMPLELDRLFYNINPRIAVIDLLDFNYPIFENWRKNCLTACVFDFQAPFKNNLFDVVINPNPKIDLTGNNILSGVKYTPISTDILSIRKKYKFKSEVKNILVSVGGADPFGQTETILSALSWFTGKINLIIGPGFKRFDWKKSNRINPVIIPPIEKFHKLLLDADIIVSAAGNTMYEAACIGIPNMVVCNHDKHLSAASAFAEKKAVINLGIRPNPIKINDLAIKFINDAQMRKSLSIHAKKLIDGKGSERIRRIIEKELKIRNL